jgi:hypothetical protein
MNCDRSLRTVANTAMLLVALASGGCGTAVKPEPKAEPETTGDAETAGVDAGAGVDGVVLGNSEAGPASIPDGASLLGEDRACVASGKELGQCAPELTCLVDADPPTRGLCKRPCQTDAACAAGQWCMTDAIADGGGVCVTPTSTGTACDGLLSGPRVCRAESEYFPFCVGGTCQLVCGFEGDKTQAPCRAGEACGTTLHDAPDFGARVRLCEKSSVPPAGFGELCDASTPCGSGLLCVYTSSQVSGFCTKTCPNPGDPCSGAPSGTSAYCLLTSADDPSVHYCGFVCQIGLTTWPCPSSDLICAADDNPPGSGQHSCEPAVQCTAGQTRICPDQGVCSGGKQPCVNGVYGPCQWTQGPSAEVCDGKDNDCNGADDDQLAAPLCGKQAGVCAGAKKTCVGAAGWLDCTTADYDASAKAKGLVFEATESRCDGQDNDCDGAADNLAACCTSVCSGKACGAADGCGGFCQSGTCPSGQSCKSGVCGCSQQECQGSCCKAGEVCAATGCCAPTCSGKACGASDGCGGTCSSGSCPSGKTCQNGVCQCGNPCGATCCSSGQKCYLGSCCTPSCSGQPCGAPDGCGGLCSSGQCPQNSTCQQGSCVCTGGTCDGGCCPDGYDYCRSQSAFGSVLYCATACGPENYGCETSSDCCSGLYCSGGLCQ